MLTPIRKTKVIIEFTPRLKIITNRIREVKGKCRIILTILGASVTHGLIIWGHSTQKKSSPLPDGRREWFPPKRSSFIEVTNSNELPWSTEEAFKSGVSSLIVTEVVEHTNLFNIRRLSLANSKWK